MKRYRVRFTPEAEDDLLRLYERWLKTGSRRSGQLLAERGVVPNPAAKNNRVQ